jgi:hypothetical protein
LADTTDENYQAPPKTEEVPE